MRVRRGFKARNRRKKVLERAKGYRSSGSRCYITAVERNDRALAFAYRDRKRRKRDFRRLWIQRINAAVRSHGWKYAQFIGALNRSDFSVDRKILADLAVHDKRGFASLVEKLKSA